MVAVVLTRPEQNYDGRCWESIFRFKRTGKPKRVTAPGRHAPTKPLDRAVQRRDVARRPFFILLFPQARQNAVPRIASNGHKRRPNETRNGSEPLRNERPLRMTVSTSNVRHGRFTVAAVLFPAVKCLMRVLRNGSEIAGRADDEKERLLRLRDIIFFYTPTVIKEFSSEKNPWGGPLPRTFRST